MSTLVEIPLGAVHAFETDDETVIELDLPTAEPMVALTFDGPTLTLRFPRVERGPAEGDEG